MSCKASGLLPLPYFPCYCETVKLRFPAPRQVDGRFKDGLFDRKQSAWFTPHIRIIRR